MINTLLLVAPSLFLFTAARQAAPAVEAAHQRNQVFLEVLREGIKVGGQAVPVPAPTFHDGLGEAERRAALLEVCGSEQALTHFLRDSVTAPYVLKTRDARTDDSTVRSIDLWFVVRADLSKLDPVKLIGQADERTVEVGNMRFEQRLLNDEDLKPRNRAARLEGDSPHWFVDLKGRLLDRIAFEAVDEAMATRAEDSMVVAARVDSGFNGSGEISNHWKDLRDDGPARPYQGGASYAKISRLRLKDAEDALIVEVHSAFVEPRDWFQGAPILRSKFAPVVQDQVRRLRRELLKERSKSNPS